jgi:methionine sulfoxide reductase heme-binding subunit
MVTTGSALWYLARGTGFVSLVLLTLVAIGGVVVRSGAQPVRLPRFVVLGLHRNVALLAVAFLGVHIVTVVLDPYVSINLVDAVIPFGSAYRPLWLGLGALAFDLLLAIVVTSLLRARIGRRTWRTIHWAAYALWPTALVHALGTGTDATRPWFLATAALCVLAVFAALAWRTALAPRDPQPSAPRAVRTAVPS